MTAAKSETTAQAGEHRGPGYGGRRAAYAVIFAITLGVLGAAVWQVKPLLSANDRSRWCTVWSLVERHTYQIDEIDAVSGWGTIDKVRQGGHYYSSKPPVLSTIVAGVYWVVRAVTGWSLNAEPDEMARTMRLILFLVNVIPLVAGLLVVMRLVEHYAASDFARLLIVGAFAFSTFLTTFSVTLNNHTIAGLAVLAALYPTCRILADGSLRPVHFACAGFFAVFAAVNELPAAAFAAAVALVLLRRSVVRALVWALRPHSCRWRSSSSRSGWRREAGSRFTPTTERTNTSMSSTGSRAIGCTRADWMRPTSRRWSTYFTARWGTTASCRSRPSFYLRWQPGLCRPCHGAGVCGPSSGARRRSPSSCWRSI